LFLVGERTKTRKDWGRKRKIKRDTRGNTRREFKKSCPRLFKEREGISVSIAIARISIKPWCGHR